jgi:hypothetical protein
LQKTKSTIKTAHGKAQQNRYLEKAGIKLMDFVINEKSKKNVLIKNVQKQELNKHYNV